jgi:hypothetical protein
MKLPDLGGYDMVVTTYGMCKMPALQHIWSPHHFNLVVLDEGHKIKNIDLQISHAVRHIHAETRVILSGTPLAKKLNTFYASLQFVNVGRPQFTCNNAIKRTPRSGWTRHLKMVINCISINATTRCCLVGGLVWPGSTALCSLYLQQEAMWVKRDIY